MRHSSGAQGETLTRDKSSQPSSTSRKMKGFQNMRRLRPACGRPKHELAALARAAPHRCVSCSSGSPASASTSRAARKNLRVSSTPHTSQLHQRHCNARAHAALLCFARLSPAVRIHEQRAHLLRFRDERAQAAHVLLHAAAAHVRIWRRLAGGRTRRVYLRDEPERMLAE